MSGFCPTGCVCRSDAGSANPRVVPDATATAQPRTTRVSSCRQCGDDPNAIIRALKLGGQMVAWDTYADNVAATARREAAQREHETAPVARWHE